MNVIKKIVKWIITIILIPVVYLLLSLVITFITVNNKENGDDKNKSIYLSSNGVHLNIIIPKNEIDTKLLEGLKYFKDDNYFSFGWGDKNFYLNTPTWNDLTFKNTFLALFINSSALLHLNKYPSIQKEWVEIKVDQNQLDKINLYIYNSFYIDSLGKKVLLLNKGYAKNDDFYEARGSFSCFKTCNSWVNSGLKQSEIKACVWTPFDFGLLSIHKK